MKKYGLITTLLLSIFGCNAQQTLNKDLPAYGKVQVSAAVNVHYRQSDTASAEISGKESDLQKIELLVEEGVLKISAKGAVSGPITVRLNNNSLKAVEASGSSSFKTTGLVKADSIFLSSSGAATVRANLNARVVDCIGSGAGSLKLSGTAQRLNANLTGAAGLKAYDLTVKEADIQATGAGNARIYATDKVKALASGASEIKFKGEPAEVISEASAAASVSRVKSAENRDKDDGDTTSLNLKNRKILVISGNEDNEENNGSKDENDEDSEQKFKHWQGFSIGVNGYTNRTGALAMPGNASYMELNYPKSINLQFNPIERQFNLIQNYVKLVVGLGLDHHIYSFAGRTILDADSLYTGGTTDANVSYVYVKNKFKNTYVQVPILLEFNTSNNHRKTFHVALGVIGQYLIGSRTKQEFTQGNDEFRRIRKDNYNLSPFGAKAHIGLGYRNWTAFGEYNLTPLFQANRGPELYPFTVGIRLISFS